MQNFTPFPLRARGSLEIFDAAIKLYKQYFWVLLGWSAIVSGASVFGMILPFGGMAAMFITPLAIGSVVCCVAAAVRGQSVEFGQCWRFTQPRYWMMLGMFILSLIIAGVIGAILVGILVGILIGGVFLFRESSGAVQVVMTILAFVGLGALYIITLILLSSWLSLVPIVICMEEDKRGTMALGRAYDILRGHWLRIISIIAVVGLAAAAFFAILAGLAALVAGIGNIRDLMQGSGVNNTALWLGIVGMGLAYAVLWVVWTPLYYLILSVFYLDVRVRQEALDLEWTAHVTAPEAEPVGTAQEPFNLQPEYSGPTVTSLTPVAPTAPTPPTEPVIPIHPTPPAESGTTPEPIAPPAPVAPPDSYTTQRLGAAELDAMPAPSPEVPVAPGDTNTPTGETPDRPTPERPATPW